MTRFTDELKNHAAAIRLSSAERSRIRESVLAAMQPVPSPFDFSAFLIPRLALTGLLTLVLAFTGTAYASTYSLPGDLLYSVKVGITEPAQGAIAFSDGAKVAWHADIATTRLAEAEALTTNGTLTAETGLALADDVRTHREAIDEIARKIGRENPISEDRIAASFSTAVANQGNAILAAGKKTANPVAMRASGDLVVQVAGESAGMEADAAADVAPEAIAMQARSAKEAPMMMSLMADVVEEEAEEDIGDLSMRAREAFLLASTTAAASTLEDSLMAEAEARLAKLASLMVKAEAQLLIGETDAAADDFKRAIEIAAEIQAQVESGSIEEPSAAL